MTYLYKGFEDKGKYIADVRETHCICNMSFSALIALFYLIIKKEPVLLSNI